MPRRPAPLFLGRSSYRQRRLRDAAGLLPLCGTFLFFLPLLWSPGTGGTRTSVVIIYLFAVWAVLILASAALSVLIRPSPDEADDGDGS